MQRKVILDAGALAALLRYRDAHHQWAVAELRRMVAPLLTCDAVLSETHFLLRDSPRALQSIMKMSLDGAFVVAFSFEDEKMAVSKLLEKYADVPMSFADACLVRMSELYPDSAVFTLDSDFKIYRRNGRQAIPLIFPEK
ncbi:MAG TPA: PIN domain-containing protein [Blastocatellia bacterium]|nr:PIN domain-containing protein [Blastocatellia bacterium]